MSPVLYWNAWKEKDYTYIHTTYKQIYIHTNILYFINLHCNLHMYMYFDFAIYSQNYHSNVKTDERQQRSNKESEDRTQQMTKMVFMTGNCYSHSYFSWLMRRNGQWIDHQICLKYDYFGHKYYLGKKKFNNFNDKFNNFLVSLSNYLCDKA